MCTEVRSFSGWSVMSTPSGERAGRPDRMSGSAAVRRGRLCRRGDVSAQRNTGLLRRELAVDVVDQIPNRVKVRARTVGKRDAEVLVRNAT